jgi:integration host factor subunit alpha
VGPGVRRPAGFEPARESAATEKSDGSRTVCAGVVRAGRTGMTGKTITRADLTEAVYRSLGISRNESSAFVERILDEVALTLENGETVKISSFGTFSVRDKKLRMGRNPKTGEEVPILPRKVLVFRPSQVLKNRINQNRQGRAAD